MKNLKSNLTEQIKEQIRKSRTITAGTWNKYHGMYIGEQNNPSCKQNRNILVTYKQSDNFSDSYWVKTKEQYKRRIAIKNSDGTIVDYHEIGDYKMKKVIRWFPNMKICDAWKTAFDYPTVSYGLSKTRREVLVVDSDQYYSSFEKAEKTVKSFVDFFDLPEVSYLLQNKESGHIQFGWFLDSPFTEEEFGEHQDLIKSLATLYKKHTHCDGDICFNGPACKNPFYEGFKSFVTDEAVSKDTMRFKVERALSVYNMPSSIYLYDNTNVPLTKSKIKTYTKSAAKKERVQASIENSRNTYLMKYLRESIWEYMRKHDGAAPTRQWCKARAFELADEAAKYTGKGVREADVNIFATLESVMNWSVAHYKDNWTNNGNPENTEKARSVSKLVRQTERFIRLVRTYSSKKTAKELAAEFGVSAKSINRDRNISKEEAELLYGSVIEFRSYARSIQENCEVSFTDDCWTALCSELDDTISIVHSSKELAELFVYNMPSSIYLYDNTNVPLTIEVEELPYDTPQSQKERAETIMNEEEELKNTLKKYTLVTIPTDVWTKRARTWNEFQKKYGKYLKSA